MEAKRTEEKRKAERGLKRFLVRTEMWVWIRVPICKKLILKPNNTKIRHAGF